MAENFMNNLNEIAANFKKQCEEGMTSGSITSWKDLVAIAQKNYDEAVKQGKKGNDDVLEQMKKADEELIKKVKDAEAEYKDRMKGIYDKLLATPKTPGNQPEALSVLETLKKMLRDAFLLISDPKSATTAESLKYIQSYQSTANGDLSKFYKEAIRQLDKAFNDQALQKLKFK